MAVFTPTGGRPRSAATTPPGQGVPQQVTIIAADTEQEVTLPAGLQGYTIINRGKTPLLISFISGGTTTTAHYTLYPNGGYTSPAMFVGDPSTMYLQTARVGDVVELITYS